MEKIYKFVITWNDGSKDSFKVKNDDDIIGKIQTSLSSVVIQVWDKNYITFYSLEHARKVHIIE
jgi:hypothetical protein